MDPSINDTPEYEFEGEGTLFLPGACDTGAVQAGTREALRSDLMVDGDEGEDHLLPPHAILEETFNATFDEEEEESVQAFAANPPIQSIQEVREKARKNNYDILNMINELQRAVYEAPDEASSRRELYSYKNYCLKVSREEYSIDANIVTGSDANPKMAKGVTYDWRTEGLSLLPNTMAGIGDLCPYRTKACTTNCLNWSGRTEMAGALAQNRIISCRMRRSLLYFHQPDAFFMRLLVLIMKRAHDAGPQRYAFRPNVLSDIAWERLHFFNPFVRGESTLVDAVLVDKVPVQCYDYTKNAVRYQQFMTGQFPKNYHLTFSLSELNALYAFYAVSHGGSATVIFDTDPATYGFRPKPAKKLPESFCGYPVIDGDLSDLRFLDRKMFGIDRRRGFFVGLRLKGRKHRERHFALKEQGIEDGFIFDGNTEYDADTLIEESEERRAEVEKVRSERGLKGDERRSYFAGFPPSMTAVLMQWWKGR